MDESSSFMDMSNISSMFSTDKLIMLFLFLIIVFVGYTCFSSTKELKNTIESIKNNQDGSSTELPAMIIKNEENITKVSNKLDVFIKYMLGQQVNAQAQAQRMHPQMQQAPQEDNDEDDIVVS